MRGSAMIIINHVFELCKKSEVYNYFSFFWHSRTPLNIKCALEISKTRLTAWNLLYVKVWKCLFIRGIKTKSGLGALILKIYLNFYQLYILDLNKKFCIKKINVSNRFWHEIKNILQQHFCTFFNLRISEDCIGFTLIHMLAFFSTAFRGSALYRQFKQRSRSLWLLSEHA